MDQVERVQCKFLSFASLVIKFDHLPHDYEPILIKLGLSYVVDGRNYANQAFLEKLIDGSKWLN